MGSDRWEQMTVGDVAGITSGKRPPHCADTPDGNPVPVYGGSGVMGWTTSALFTDQVLITGRVGTLGVINTTNGASWPSDNTLVIIPDLSRVSYRYLYYSLVLTVKLLAGYNRGTSNPLIVQRDVKTLPLLLPPLPEQRAIAHILGSLDDKIELNRRMNKALEATARAIFKSWFVDFDPVRAKAEGRPTGLPDDIASLFPDSFEDSELGEIPKGWGIKPIGQAVKCVGGTTPSTKNPAFWDGGKNPFVTPKDMSSLTSPVILDTSRHITDAGVDKINSGRLPIGSVILSSRAPIGYLAITEVPVSVNQGVIAMICNKDLPNYYVLHWTETNMDTIKRNAGGTTFAEISKRNFRPIPVVVPQKLVLEAFVQQVEPLHKQVVLNLQESNTLASLRDTLLPKLISGELRVPDAEKFIEEAGV